MQGSTTAAKAKAKPVSTSKPMAAKKAAPAKKSEATLKPYRGGSGKPPIDTPSKYSIRRAYRGDYGRE